MAELEPGVQLTWRWKRGTVTWFYGQVNGHRYRQYGEEALP